MHMVCDLCIPVGLFEVASSQDTCMRIYVLVHIRMYSNTMTVDCNNFGWKSPAEGSDLWWRCAVTVRCT